MRAPILHSTRPYDLPMATKLFTSAGMLIATLGVAACGGGDPSSNELVRLHFEDTLDFRMDPSDGPEHVVRFDETITIDRDGHGTRTSAAFDGTRTFEITEAQERHLNDALAMLDFERLDQRLGTDSGHRGSSTITYGGLSARWRTTASRGPVPGKVAN